MTGEDLALKKELERKIGAIGDLQQGRDELSAQLPELDAELAALNAKYPRPETEIDTDEMYGNKSTMNGLSFKIF